MKRFRLFWILYSVLIISGCTSARPMGISSGDTASGENSYPGSSEYQKRVFSSYCRSGKQIKSFKEKIRFVVPKAEQGMPLDNANSLLDGFNEERACMLKIGFRSLSSWNRCNDEKCDYQEEAEGKLGTYRNIFYTVEESAVGLQSKAKSVRFSKEFEDVRQGLVFLLPKESDKIYLVLQREVTSRSRYGVEKTYTSENNRAYFSDLAALFVGYTMMVPKAVQKEIFQVDEDCSSVRNFGSRNQFCRSDGRACSYYGFEVSHKLLGYDESDNPKLTPSVAIEDRVPIWDRYFLTFTSLKEAVTDDPQVVDYEASLDLNHFCKYARHLDDLVSQ